MLREAPANLLLAPNPDGIPVEGFHKGAVTATVADGALSVVIDQTGSHRMNIPVAANWKTLKLSFQWKTENVRRGDADWKDARIALRFYDAKGGVGPWPNNFTQSGTSDWKSAERVYEIPEGATSLAFEPANFGAEGVVRFENLSLTLEALR